MNPSLDIVLYLRCFKAEKVTIRLIYYMKELLDKDNSFTVHHFNIQSLATEMFKVINNIAAIIIDDLFTTYHIKYSLKI